MEHYCEEVCTIFQKDCDYLHNQCNHQYHNYCRYKSIQCNQDFFHHHNNELDMNIQEHLLSILRKQGKNFQLRHIFRITLHNSNRFDHYSQIFHQYNHMLAGQHDLPSIQCIYYFYLCKRYIYSHILINIKNIFNNYLRSPPNQPHHNIRNGNHIVGQVFYFPQSKPYILLVFRHIKCNFYHIL